MAHELTKLGVLSKPYHAGSTVFPPSGCRRIRKTQIFVLERLNLCFSPAGLRSADRTEVQNEWMQGEVLVIVATISFGMGVDKANVR